MRAQEWGSSCGDPVAHCAHVAAVSSLAQRPGCHPELLPSVTPHPHHQRVSCFRFRVVSSVHHPLPGPASPSRLDCGRGLLRGLPTSTSALHCPLSTGSPEDPIGSPMRSHHWSVVPSLLRTKHQLPDTARIPPSVTALLPSAHPASATPATPLCLPGHRQTGC